MKIGVYACVPIHSLHKEKFQLGLWSEFADVMNRKSKIITSYTVSFAKLSAAILYIILIHTGTASVSHCFAFKLSNQTVDSYAEGYRWLPMVTDGYRYRSNYADYSP